MVFIRFWRGAAVAASLVAFGYLAPTAQAQQNLFNIPSGRITEPGELFFQEQFNFSRPVGSSNTTFDFGLGNGFEIGVNALDFSFYENIRPVPGARRQENPDLLLNAQKGFEVIEDVWSLGVGTQAGLNPSRQARKVRFQNFTWGINEFVLPEDRARLYTGVYYANVAYAGPGARAGYMLGAEVPIIKDRLSFQADFISGQRDISVFVVGAVVTFPRKWQLSLGVQLPAPHSGNPYGVVVEFTYPGCPLFARRSD